MTISTPTAQLQDATSPSRALARLAGARILVLNWRDITHPDAGGAETYVHEIARRWVRAGAAVTMLTARPAGADARASIDGIEIRRAGGTFSVYLRAALALLRHGRRYDAVVDCQNGIPFFAPLFTDTPVVSLVHHVHQDQFATRFPPALAALGRLLEGRVARRVYARHRSVAVSASTRQEMRTRLRFGGIVDIVPNGVTPPGGRSRVRASAPTVVLVSRLVPHKRVDLLLDAVATIRDEVPGLRVEVVGDGPELGRLRDRASALGLGGTVTFHGRLPTAERDELVRSAWLTTSTSAAEGWGQTVLEAAAVGVPCVALRAPGVRDSVVEGRTGWLVENPDWFPESLAAALAELARADDAARIADACRRWAACFTWERSAEMLAACVVTESGRPERGGRRERSDSTTLARFTHPDPAAATAGLRLTDEVAVTGTTMTAILRGQDDLDALTVLARIGATHVRVRPAVRHEMLGGPAAAQEERPWVPAQRRPA